MIIGWPGQNLCASARAVVGGDGAAAGYTAADVKNYDTADIAKWDLVGTTPKTISFDRWNGGASLVTPSTPTAIWISNWADSGFNFFANTTKIEKIEVIEADNASLITNPVGLAQIDPGSPTYGQKSFGLATLFAEFSTPSVNKRYIGIKITPTATTTVTIGNIFISYVTDSGAEGWGFSHDWELAQIDRRRVTEMEGGGVSILTRDSIRRVSGQVKIAQPVFDKFLDAVQGRNTALVDSTANPLAVCFDEDNKARAVTGQHYFSGLWKYDGSPLASGGKGFFSQTVQFNPDVPMVFREYK